MVVAALCLPDGIRRYLPLICCEVPLCCSSVVPPVLLYLGLCIYLFVGVLTRATGDTRKAYTPHSKYFFSTALPSCCGINDDCHHQHRHHQVFEQMMRQASERPAMPASMALCSPSSSSTLGSPSSNGYGHGHGFVMPFGTPARRLSSCVVARDGGGEFFAQSPAPGRPASFFR